MKPDDFARRLKELREERGIGSREMSDLIERSPGFISLIESRQRYKTKLPPMEALQAIANVFEMSIDELLSEDGRPGRTRILEAVPEIQTVPLAELLRRINARPAYGDRAEDLKASAGRKKGRVPQGYDDARLRKRLGAGDLPERIQLIEVEGDCMVKALYPGDVVLVDTQQTPEIGKIVAAVRFHDEVIVKFLREKDDRQYFASMDGKIVIPLDQYTRVLGPVVDVQRSIDRILGEL